MKSLKSLLVLFCLIMVWCAFPAEGQAADWTWQNPLPQGNHLRGVWGRSGSDVFAVGDDGTILHYNGTSWSSMDSGTSEHLNGVWGHSGSDVFAVGNGGAILHYDGTSWSYMFSGTSEDLYGVWGRSGSDVFAVGDGTILHYNGTSWSSMDSGTSRDLYGVWGSSGSNVFAVGTTNILHYDGTSWSSMSDISNRLHGVWGNSGSDVFAVGRSGEILHYDGTSWTSMADTSEDLRGVWGNSGSDVFAVGDDGAILHYDGTSWTSMFSNTSRDLYGVWGNSGSDVFAVGDYGKILHYDGTSWSSMDSGTSEDLRDVWGNSSSDVFAVGEVGTILHYDGMSWSSMAGTSNQLYGAWGSSGSDVFAVGRYGTILHYNGTSWNSMDSSSKHLYSVWGISGSDVFAVGDDGTILHYNGTSWGSMDSGTSDILSGVWGSSGSDVFAVGYSSDADAGSRTRTILHYDGTSWSSMDSGTSGTLTDVWGSSDSDVFAVGYSSDPDTGANLAGTILHYDGTSWTSMFSGTSNRLNGVWGSSRSNIFAVGSSGKILHYDGTLWNSMDSGTSRDLSGVWRSSDSDVFAVGEYGTILHYDDPRLPTAIPKITDQKALSIRESAPLTITLNDLTVEDSDSTYPDDFTLTVQDGENYTRMGNTIMSSADFSGTLTVPVTVSDGTDSSKVFSLTVTVLGAINILSPSPDSTWDIGSRMDITWDTLDIPGNVEISVSRQGEDGPYESMAENTENDGSYEWTVTGYVSEKCVIKIIPLTYLSCEATQGQFTIRMNPPENLALSSDDDTGRSNSDDVTRRTSGLTITGSGNSGVTVQLYKSGGRIPGASCIVSGGVFSIDISLTKGAHIITAVQTDIAGNKSDASPPLKVTVDNEVLPPSRLSLFPAKDSGISNTDNLTQHTSGLKIIGSGEEGATVQLYDNGIPISGETVAVSDFFSAVISLREGEHNIAAVQADIAGNISIPSDVLTVTVDTTPPVSPVFREPVTPTNNTMPTWNWISEDGNGNFRYKLDNSDLSSDATHTPNTAYTPETELRDGYHVLYVQECDDAGNWSDLAVCVIVVDTDASGGPAVSGITPTNDTTPTWTWTSGDTENGRGIWQYKLNNADLGNGAIPTTKTSYTPNSPLSPEGPHTLYVQELDDAGNWSPAGSFTIETDSGKPCSRAAAPSSADAGTRSLTITYTCDDIYDRGTCGDASSGSGVETVELYVRKPGDTRYHSVARDTANEIDGVFKYMASDSGEYLFHTIASDRAGNTEELPAQEYDTSTVYTSDFSGYAILSVGSVKGQEGIEAHTLSANNIYSHLIQHGFGLVSDQVEKWNDPLDNIKYFNPYEEPQTGEDDYSGDGSYKQAMQKAVTEWAADKMKTLPGTLYLILLDHGSPDAFYLTGEQPLTAQELGGWLDILQDQMKAEEIDRPLVIVFGACYSGSFIDDLSAPGRIIVASSAAGEPSYRGPVNPYSGVRDGEFFTSSLFKELNEGYSLRTAFGRAVIRAETYTDSGKPDKSEFWHDTATQHPLLDDNGDGVGTNSLSASGGDGSGAGDIFLGHGDDAPEPLRVTAVGSDLLTLDASENQATLWAEVSDTERTDSVWAEIRKPDMILEQKGEGENQQTLELDSLPLAWNDSEERYEGVYDDFTDPGKYTLFFYAKDKTGIISSFRKAYLRKGLLPVQGDVNGNEITDLADVILILRILCDSDISIEAVTPAGDLSEDGKIGIEDAVGIFRQLAGF